MTDDHLHAADPLPPMFDDFRPTNATAAELLHIVAVLMVEIDALRIEQGYQPHGPRRSFTREVQNQGRDLCPHTFIGESHELAVHLES